MLPDQGVKALDMMPRIDMLQGVHFRKYGMVNQTRKCYQQKQGQDFPEALYSEKGPDFDKALNFEQHKILKRRMNLQGTRSKFG